MDQEVHMSKIRIITDTDASLPVELAAKHNIFQVPITIQFGDETYESGVNINDKTLFEKIDALGKLPTTAAPSPAAFKTAFDDAFNTGAESIVCVVVGSKISRTYESAIAACEEFPGKLITVVDSEYLSLGQGYMALAAAEAAEAGATHDQVVQAARDVLPRLHLFGSLTTLKYLAMGGRIGKFPANMANLLDIRPIMTMIEGKLDLLEKVRTHRVAMNRLVQLLEKSVEGKEIVKAGITHVNNLEDAKILEARLRTVLDIPAEIIITEFTPGLSVHGGTGLVAAVLVTKE
jgi:DegV family protein with EDD domain